MAKAIAKRPTRAEKTSKARRIRKGDASRRAASGASGAASGRGSAPRLQNNNGSKQKFHARHFREQDFRPDGLRPYARYRDLGMSAASGGLLQAHVIRLVPPCDPAVVSKRHYHEVELQMIYVLRGWIKGEYDGKLVTLHQGAAWLQPPRIKHRVLDYSDDCELLELVVPADFKTVELEA